MVVAAFGMGLDDRPIKITKNIKTFLIVWVSALFIATLMPSRDTSFLMISAYAGTELANAESATEIGSKGIQAVNKFLDDYIAEE